MRKRVGKEWNNRVRQTSNVADKKLNILLWGAPGTGKTRFMGTAPRPFIIAAEDGVLTLANKDIPYYLLQDDEKVYDTVMQILEDARLKKGIFEEIETICLDSVWKLNKMLMDEILDDANVEKAQFDHWGKLGTRVSKIVEGFLKTDFHFIASVGEKVKEDKLTEELRPTFNMSGSYADQIAYEFDFNIFMKKKAVGSRINFLAYSLDENKRTAKSRVELPREMANLDFNFLWNTVQKALNKENN